MQLVSSHLAGTSLPRKPSVYSQCNMPWGGGVGGGKSLRMISTEPKIIYPDFLSCNEPRGVCMDCIVPTVTRRKKTRLPWAPSFSSALLSPLPQHLRATVPCCQTAREHQENHGGARWTQLNDEETKTTTILTFYFLFCPSAPQLVLRCCVDTRGGG